MTLRLPRTTTYDLPLLVVVLALLLLGLVMVYSASGISALDARDDPTARRPLAVPNTPCLAHPG